MSTNTTSTLNNLIQTLKDGQEGFRSAAENAKSAELKNVFTDFSEQRGQFASELQSIAASLGEKEPADSPSLSGTIHRGWINLKTAITGNSDHGILEECERGEDSAVAQYKKALGEGLVGDVASVIQRQAAAVKAAHDRVRNLRDGVTA